MLDETQLDLLKLTAQGKAVNLEEFLTQARQRQLTLATINHLLQTGLVSMANGFLSMDVSQRMMLASRLIHEGRDPTRVSRVLEWQEFEKFANDSLIENGFQTLKHFVFKASSGRREIDVLAWNDNFVLAIDCKHWLRGISPGRLVLAAQRQTERVRALAKRPELLARAKIGDLAERSITPIILTLGEAPKRSADGVPIVSVSRLMNFLYGVSPIDDSILRVHIESTGSQSLLL
jgi:hypothetical protein